MPTRRLAEAYCTACSRLTRRVHSTNEHHPTQKDGYRIHRLDVRADTSTRRQKIVRLLEGACAFLERTPRHPSKCWLILLALTSPWHTGHSTISRSLGLLAFFTPSGDPADAADAAVAADAAAPAPSVGGWLPSPCCTGMKVDKNVVIPLNILHSLEAKGFCTV